MLNLNPGEFVLISTARRVFVNEPTDGKKAFISINCQATGPGGRGSFWIDLCAWGDDASDLFETQEGDPVRVVAALDSRKGQDGTWRLRAIFQRHLDADEQIAEAPQMELAGVA